MVFQDRSEGAEELGRCRGTRRHNPCVAGRFVFVPDCRPDEVDGHVEVEAAGLPGVLRTVQFAKGETDEGLDVLVPVVVQASLSSSGTRQGDFSAVIEQVRGKPPSGSGGFSGAGWPSPAGPVAVSGNAVLAHFFS